MSMATTLQNWFCVNWTKMVTYRFMGPPPPRPLASVPPPHPGTKGGATFASVTSTSFLVGRIIWSNALLPSVITVSVACWLCSLLLFLSSVSQVEISGVFSWSHAPVKLYNEVFVFILLELLLFFLKEKDSPEMNNRDYLKVSCQNFFEKYRSSCGCPMDLLTI